MGDTNSKIIIFWDHGNTKSILACASGQYPALEGPSALPLKYNTKTYLINDLFIPQKDNTFSKSAGDEYKVLLEIDVANSKINVTYALAKLKIISIANDNKKDPVRFFVKKYKNNRYFKDVIKNIKKILRLKKHNHTKVVRKFGKACSYPGTFMGSIHAMITSNNYKSAINKTIKAGGCNCSRANFVGAYFAAYKGFKNIPSQWIKKTLPAKNILKYI